MQQDTISVSFNKIKVGGTLNYPNLNNMKLLEIPELAQLNTLLSHIEADDGSRITGRLEVYSCATGSSPNH